MPDDLLVVDQATRVSATEPERFAHEALGVEWARDAAADRSTAEPSCRTSRWACWTSCG
jgi:hypothetical protein